MAKPKIKDIPKKLHVKKGDKVTVISGKDKGKIGEITKVFTSKGKVVVEGVNIVTKHVKPSQSNPQGGIIKQSNPIFSSNVMVYDEKSGRPVRTGKKIIDGKKVRYSKVSGEIL